MKHNGFLVGLTGQTGGGKTTVANYLRQKDYSVIDADQIARKVVSKGSDCLMDLVLQFGVEILMTDGSLNRRKLGDMVFADEEKRKLLNRISFPYIQAAILKQVKSLLDAGDTVFLDAPTLFESEFHRECDRVVSVIAPADLRYSRIRARDDITEKQARDRMASQYGDSYYEEKSDYVLINDKDLATLYGQVDWMLEQLRQATAEKQAGGREAGAQ